MTRECVRYELYTAGNVSVNCVRKIILLHTRGRGWLDLVGEKLVNQKR